MIITLYYNQSDQLELNKSLQTVATLNGELREATDILQPEIEIEGAEVLNANYLYINELHRFYFITGCEFVSGTIYRIRCKVDVLSTYKNEIKRQYAIVKRNQYNYNTYLTDDRLKTNNNPHIQTLSFPNGFSKEAYSYILVMGGNSFNISTTPPNNS